MRSLQAKSLVLLVVATILAATIPSIAHSYATIVKYRITGHPGYAQFYWESGSEDGLVRFSLYRKTKTSKWVLVKNIPPKSGGVVGGQIYRYKDHIAPGHYKYKIVIVMTGGVRDSTVPRWVRVK